MSWDFGCNALGNDQGSVFGPKEGICYNTEGDNMKVHVNYGYIFQMCKSSIIIGYPIFMMCGCATNDCNIPDLITNSLNYFNQRECPSCTLYTLVWLTTQIQYHMKIWTLISVDLPYLPQYFQCHDHISTNTIWEKTISNCKVSWSWPCDQSSCNKTWRKTMPVNFQKITSNWQLIRVTYKQFFFFDTISRTRM